MTKIEKICELGLEDAVVFSEPAYEDAIIGISHDRRVVYEYNKMVEGLLAHEDLTEEQAREWIDYNTLRSLRYNDKAPIVIFSIEED